MFRSSAVGEWHVGQRLPAGVANDEALVLVLLDGPGRREAAGHASFI
jgi:hypothetical protein